MPSIDSHVGTTKEGTVVDQGSLLVELNKFKSVLDTLSKGQYARFRFASRHLNPYELIPQVSDVAYTSRAFFKLLELLWGNKVVDPTARLTVTFLAEAPGGFIDCVHHLHPQVDFKAITLESDRPLVEKIHEDFRQHVIYGPCGGDLTDPGSVRFLREQRDNGSMLVTADGGFDISSDYNRQEELSTPLILGEVVAALVCQAPGGTFVLKTFDVFTEDMMRLIQVLHDAYEEVHMVKPKTSRVCNSERYMVCTRFKRAPTDAEVARLCESMDTGDLSWVVVGPRVRESVHWFNKQAVLCQKTFISQSVRMALEHRGRIPDPLRAPALQFCLDHGVPICS